jgi:N6-L-threonylcarbamoyladenine synthase
VQNGSTVLGHAIASSAEIHRRYGGVFPELACRRHIDAILPVIAEALKDSQVPIEAIDSIAVAKGPGLIGAVLIGLQAAKGLSIAWKKPLIGINHIEAHLYAALIPFEETRTLRPGFTNQEPLFPALGFVLSGGHTLMLKVNGIGSYELIGTTVDDAIGEAFDKAAAILGLSYPGGPALEKLAEQGDASKFRFSQPKVKKNPLAFSFSGLKTAVLYAQKNATINDYPHIAAAFQKTAFEDLMNKAELAMQSIPCRSILFGGGVTNNRRLRAVFSERFPKIPLFWPSSGLSADNAIMIAGLAHHKFLCGETAPLDLEAMARLPFWIEKKD